MPCRLRITLRDGSRIDEALLCSAKDLAATIRLLMSEGRKGGATQFFTADRQYLWIRPETVRTVRVYDDASVSAGTPGAGDPSPATPPARTASELAKVTQASTRPVDPVPVSSAAASAGTSVRSARLRAPSFVYFVQSEATGRIKIGRTRDLKGRIASLRIGNGSEVTLLASLPGKEELERSYHKQFASGRSFGEWFEPTEDLLAEIARINAKAAS